MDLEFNIRLVSWEPRDLGSCQAILSWDPVDFGSCFFFATAHVCPYSIEASSFCQDLSTNCSIGSMIQSTLLKKRGVRSKYTILYEIVTAIADRRRPYHPGIPKMYPFKMRHIQKRRYLRIYQCRYFKVRYCQTVNDTVCFETLTLKPTLSHSLVWVHLVSNNWRLLWLLQPYSQSLYFIGTNSDMSMDPKDGSMIPEDLSTNCSIGSMIQSNPMVKFDSRSWIPLDTSVMFGIGSRIPSDPWWN